MGIGQLATETNEELRAVKGEPADGFDVGAVLAIARRCTNYPHV
jgi:vacuole morphology and inheritance protein 14